MNFYANNQIKMQKYAENALSSKKNVTFTPEIALLCPFFVKYTKGETYFLVAVMSFWLLADVSHYIF
jgi:hypothetical protein